MRGDKKTKAVPRAPRPTEKPGWTSTGLLARSSLGGLESLVASLADRVGRFEKELLKERRAALKRVTVLERDLDQECRRADGAEKSFKERINKALADKAKAEATVEECERDTDFLILLAQKAMAEIAKEPRLVGSEVDRFVWRAGHALACMAERRRGEARAYWDGDLDSSWRSEVLDSGERPFNEVPKTDGTDPYEPGAKLLHLELDGGSSQWNLSSYSGHGNDRLAHLSSLGRTMKVVTLGELRDKSKWVPA